MLIIQIPIKKKKVCMVVWVFAVLSGVYGEKHCHSYSRVSTSTVLGLSGYVQMGLPFIILDGHPQLVITHDQQLISGPELSDFWILLCTRVHFL